MEDEDDVVISGISGRLPECDNLDEFWAKLKDGIDLVTENDRRWPAGAYGLPRRKATLKTDLEKFDSKFFNVSFKQAEKFDPQIAQLLEVTYEAILDAGVNPTTLRGANVGVIAGCSSYDTAECMRLNPDSGTPYDLLGTAPCLVANRISYSLDFTGPSYTLDTYCSSSMIALHNAVAAIKNGECESALVCGANLLLNPSVSIQMVKVGVLSKDGKCKSFDATGDGYVRGEAIVSVFLQKRKVARRNYGTIIHTKSNADGYKQIGISHPSGKAQEKLMMETYQEAGLDPNTVSFVEAHGTGTSAGDPEELNAIANVFAKNRTKDSPLLIASTKSVLGHAEGAASLCALAKVLLSLKNGIIPPNLHFNVPNPKIPSLLNGKLKVITECTPINGTVFSVNASGIGGSNAHIILKSEVDLNLGSTFPETSVPILIPFSGRTKDAVNFGLERIVAAKGGGSIGLLQKIHEDPITGFDYRGHVIFDESKKETVVEPQVEIEESTRPLWFIFAGMGSQWTGMARELMEFPTFKESIDASAEIMKEFDLSLYDVLVNRPEELMSKFIGISYMAVGMGLYDLITSVGLEPDGLIGHSAGEILCAYADGSLTRREALLIKMFKDEAVHLCPTGTMAAVGMSWEEATAQCPEGIYPACHNGSKSVTIGGPIDKTKAFVKELSAKGIFAREVDTEGVAFHTPYLKDAAPLYDAKVRGILTNPRKRSKKWISSSLPEAMWNDPIAETTSADYIVNNFTSPVRFYNALKYIPANAVVLEISSHALFQSILKKDLPPTCSVFGLMKRNEQDNAFRIVSALGSLFQAGFNPKFSKLYPENSFPVTTGSAMIAPLIKWNHEDTFKLPDFNKLTSGNSSQVVEISRSGEDEYLEGHTIDNRVLFPATGYLVLVWKALAKLKCVDFQKLPVRFENIKFERATILSNAETKTQMKINILETTGQFEITEGASVVVTGKVYESESLALPKIPAYETSIKTKTSFPEIEQRDLYKWFKLRGYQYEGPFKGIISAQMNGEICKLQWQNNWVAFLDTVIQTKLLSSTSPPGQLYVPTGMAKLTIDPNIFGKFIDNNKGSEVTILASDFQKTILGPGIEVHGLKFAETLRREKVQPAPILEEYAFVPYMDSQDVAWEVPTVLKICVDIILENTTSKFLKLFEFVEPGNDDSIGRQMQTLNNHPSRKIHVECLSESTADTSVKLSTNGTTGAADKQCELLVIREFPNQISKYASLVTPNGFALFITTNSNPAELIQHIKESCWNPIPVAYKKTQDYQFYLLKKNQEELVEEIRVEIDSEHNWIQTVQNIFAQAGKNSPPILLHSNLIDSGIIGLVNCLRAEPQGGNIRCVFGFAVDKIPDNDLTMNVMNDDGDIGSYRHLAIPPLKHEVARTKNFCLTQMMRGNISSLRWIEVPFMKKHPNVYDVYYGSLNFRDIMIATGQLSPEALPIGCRNENVIGTEFVGIDSQGERVMGAIPYKSLATQIRTTQGLFWRVPDNWSMEDAATVPVAYSTAYYALIIRGQLKSGESILIHSGTGAVGQASIAIALSMQCQVFTTVGSDYKKAYLMEIFPQLTDKNFANTRTTDFKDYILRETQGRGVDLVLNSLAEDKLQASLESLACDGRFLEIGKYDMFKDSTLGMSVFLRNISFHGVLLENAAFSLYTEEANQEIHRLVQEGILSGVVQPIKRIVYPFEEALEAFRFMATGKHVGKIILKIRDELECPAPPTALAIPFTYFDPCKVYIIVGGLGGVGIEMADWFVSRGAKKLALVSRSGIVNSFQELRTNRWKQAGIQVLIGRQDMSTLTGVKDLFEECLKQGPIGGIFNLAMVLRDGLFKNQTVEDFEIVLKPKLSVTRNLDLASRQLGKDLDHFVIFSSVSCGRGNAGQTNYGFANSSMERICENRRRHGFPALAIQWGAIAEAGVVHENMKGKDGLVGGTVPQFLSSCFAALDKFLRFQHEFKSPIVSSIVLPEPEDANAEILGSNKKLSLCAVIAQTLGIKDTSKISRQLTLGELGVDSLLSVEVQTILEKYTSTNYSANEVRLLTWDNLEAIDKANA